MYITKEQSEQLIKEFFEGLKTNYSEKLDFILNLIENDDWSFVIKSHALIESLVTELIITQISEETLKPIIERIPLHGDIVSKIEILKKYELLTLDQIKFIVKLSEIRNSIVHKYENINFSFENYISSLDKNNKTNWRNLLNIESIEKAKMEKLFSQQPRIAVWFKLMNLVNTSLSKIHEMKIEQKSIQEANKTGNEILNILMKNA